MRRELQKRINDLSPLKLEALEKYLDRLEKEFPWEVMTEEELLEGLKKLEPPTED